MTLKVNVNGKEINVDGSNACDVYLYHNGESQKENIPAEWGQYVIVRTYSAGVFAGYLEKRNGKEGTIRKARRLWMWYGAASLSQLAVDGVSLPNECKFPCEVDKIEVTEIVEVVYTTEKARLSIASVPIWKA